MGELEQIIRLLDNLPRENAAKVIEELYDRYRIRSNGDFVIKRGLPDHDYIGARVSIAMRLKEIKQNWVFSRLIGEASLVGRDNVAILYQPVHLDSETAFNFSILNNSNTGYAWQLLFLFQKRNSTLKELLDPSNQYNRVMNAVYKVVVEEGRKASQSLQTETA